MRNRRCRRDGFTLVEVLITTIMIALVSAVIAVVFVTILRTRPTAEARVDDARSLLGVTTWFPGDVNSTPVQQDTPAARLNVWNIDPGAPSGCAGGLGGTNLIRLRWEEQDGSTTTYEAGYRYVDAGGWRIQRVACELGGAAEVVNLTAQLPEPSSTPPQSFLDVRSIGGSDFIVGAWLEITTIEGDDLRVDAVSESPNETLAPPPTIVTTSSSTSVVGNIEPFAGDVDVTMQLGTTFTLAVPATDSDGPSALTYVSNTNLAPQIGVTAGSLPLEIDIADVSSTDGAVFFFGYTVTDGADVATGTVKVTMSSTGPSGTTTTTTTTSTTVPTPCSATTLGVDKTSVRNQNPANGNDTNKGPLAEPVNVTVTTSGGDCSGLQLRFSFEADPYPLNKEQSVLFGASSTITFQTLSTERWDDGNHTFSLFDAVAGVAVGATATLEVT